MPKEKKMNMLIRFCIIVLGILPFTTFGQTDWKSLNGEKYSISYPSNWDLDDSGAMGSKFFLFSKLVSPQDQFKENVNLLTQDISTYNLNLDQYVELSKGQVLSMIKEGKILSSTRVTDDGPEYHSLIYTGKQAENTLRFEQQFWIIDKTAFILTFTSQLDNYDQYREIGNKIIGSFKLLN